LVVHMVAPGESTRTGAQNHNRFCRLKKIPDGLLETMPSWPM
jgi:hypothetical protein